MSTSCRSTCWNVVTTSAPSTRNPDGSTNSTWMSTSGSSSRELNGRSAANEVEAAATAVPGTRPPAPPGERSQVACRPPSATGQSPLFAKPTLSEVEVNSTVMLGGSGEPAALRWTPSSSTVVPSRLTGMSVETESVGSAVGVSAGALSGGVLTGAVPAGAASVGTVPAGAVSVGPADPVLLGRLAMGGNRAAAGLNVAVGAIVGAAVSAGLTDGLTSEGTPVPGDAAGLVTPTGASGALASGWLPPVAIVNTATAAATMPTVTAAADAAPELAATCSLNLDKSPSRPTAPTPVEAR